MFNLFRSLRPAGAAGALRPAAMAVAGILVLSACAGQDSDIQKPLPFAFTGDSYYGTLSGVSGKAVILEPGADDLAVERIAWRRTGLLPCLMQVYKRAPNNPARVSVDKSEECEGAKGDESEVKSVGELNAAFAPTMRVITGLRACYPKKGKGKRLAALEVEISELKADGTISPPVTGSEERFGNGFDDCGEVAEWSRCAAGGVGTGVRTHFDKALGSRFIVGVELRCRTLGKAS